MSTYIYAHDIAIASVVSPFVLSFRARVDEDVVSSIVGAMHGSFLAFTHDFMSIQSFALCVDVVPVIHI